MKRLQARLCAVLRAHLSEGKAPYIPEAGAIFWKAFAALHGARQEGPHGPQPIALVEIEAWARLNRLPFRPEHVAVIRALDRVYLDHARAVLSGKSAGPLPQMTPELFDVMV